MTGEGEQASGTREGGPPESTMVVTAGGAGEPPGPEPPRVQVTPRTVLVVMLTALALLAGLYLLWEVRNIVVWCVVAVFLAVALNPAVDWLDRRGLPRVVAIVLVYLALLLLVVGITALLLPPLISQGQALVTFVIDLVRDPPGGTPQAALQDLADSYGLGGYLNDYLDTLRDQIGSLPERLSAAVAPLVSVTRSIIGGVVSLISVLLLTFFLLLDGRRFVETGLLLVEPSWRPRIQRLLDRSAQAVSGYITGNLAISLIAGVATYIALVLLGVPYALTLALAVAFFDLIPLIGATQGSPGSYRRRAFHVPADGGDTDSVLRGLATGREPRPPASGLQPQRTPPSYSGVSSSRGRRGTARDTGGAAGDPRGRDLTHPRGRVVRCPYSADGRARASRRTGRDS